MGITLDPCQGSLYKGIFIFSLPLIFTNMLQVLFNIADVAVAGRFAGAAALGAVGSTTTPIYFYIGMLIGIASGVNAIVAYYVGAKRDNLRNSTIYTAFFVCLASGIVLMAIGIILCRPVLAAMNTKPELMESAVLYFCICMMGLPALALYNFGNAVLNAIGDTRRPLIYLLVAGVINVALDILFIVPFKMGVAGVALATALSQGVSAGLVLNAVFRRT
ncbi:MAG: polysaccharide biosynthesis C-terminal domain-containing protein, partial [Spirochaetia bacterium]|nr:polysaccharide biosynthesis C-terminal domain-containing protein [Spirochaetia bacterium]